MSDTPRMSSRTTSLACLSEARSTMRRARLNASALSGSERCSSTNREWLSMSATIAPHVPSALREFVNSSDGLMACFVEGQARRGSIQKRGADRLVHRHFSRGGAAWRCSEQDLPKLTRDALEPSKADVA